MAKVKAKETTSPNLSLRLGTDGRKTVNSLTTQANFEKPNQFAKALFSRVAEITDGQPFDVRDLRLGGQP